MDVMVKGGQMGDADLLYPPVMRVIKAASLSRNFPSPSCGRLDVDY
jgi:hypothetical protein